jgi:tetratricopeptide (TPR) repeat protein
MRISLQAYSHFKLGYLAFLGDADPIDALASLEAALTLDPHYFDALILKTDILLSLEAPAQALTVLDRALKVHPHHPDLCLAKLQLYRTMGMDRKALNYCSHLLRQSQHLDDWLMAWLFRDKIQLQLELGRPWSARCTLRQARQLLSLEACQALLPLFRRSTWLTPGQYSGNRYGARSSAALTLVATVPG